jgi:hypothetical protein
MKGFTKSRKVFDSSNSNFRSSSPNGSLSHPHRLRSSRLYRPCRAGTLELFEIQEPTHHAIVPLSLSR